MLSGLFATTLYIRVRKNQFRVRNVETGDELTFLAETPFTTARMLVGTFTSADAAIKRAIAQLPTRNPLKMSSRIVIHPLEMIEGGLSEIEDRILRELCVGAGASAVVVVTGPELSDADAKVRF